MTKFFIGLLAIIALAIPAQLFFSWWVIAPIAMLVGALLNQKAMLSFGFGFLSIALLWGIYAALLNSGNEGILASRMGQLFGGFGAGTMILLTAILGGLVSGLGAMTGSLGRRLGSLDE